MKEEKQVAQFVIASKKPFHSLHWRPDYIRNAKISYEQALANLLNGKTVVLGPTIHTLSRMYKDKHMLSKKEIILNCAIEGFDPDFFVLEDDDYNTEEIYDLRTNKKIQRL